MPAITPPSNIVDIAPVITPPSNKIPFDLKNGEIYNNKKIYLFNLNSDTLEIGPVQIFDPNVDVLMSYKINPNSKYISFDDESANLFFDRIELM